VFLAGNISLAYIASLSSLPAWVSWTVQNNRVGISTADSDYSQSACPTQDVVITIATVGCEELTATDESTIAVNVENAAKVWAGSAPVMASATAQCPLVYITTTLGSNPQGGSTKTMEAVANLVTAINFPQEEGGFNPNEIFVNTPASVAVEPILAQIILTGIPVKQSSPATTTLPPWVWACIGLVGCLVVLVLIVVTIWLVMRRREKKKPLTFLPPSRKPSLQEALYRPGEQEARPLADDAQPVKLDEALDET